MSLTKGSSLHWFCSLSSKSYIEESIEMLLLLQSGLAYMYRVLSQAKKERPIIL
jgi:hypothetical protein